MATLKGLKDLALCAAQNKAPSDAPTEFQNASDVNATLRDELKNRINERLNKSN